MVGDEDACSHLQRRCVVNWRKVKDGTGKVAEPNLHKELENERGDLTATVFKNTEGCSL